MGILKEQAYKINDPAALFAAGSHLKIHKTAAAAPPRALPRINETEVRMKLHQNGVYLVNGKLTDTAPAGITQEKAAEKQLNLIKFKSRFGRCNIKKIR